MKIFSVLLPVTLIALYSAVPGSAASVLTVDESGNGNINGTALTYSLTTDPGPGGLSNVLTYPLPFTGFTGDVEIIEPETGIPGDIIRFNANGTLLYYSMGTAPNTPYLADQPRPPFPVSNTVQITETSSDDAFYTPTSGQPGYDSSSPSYHFIGGAVTSTPEPASVALMLVGGAGLFFSSLRKR